MILVLYLLMLQSPAAHCAPRGSQYLGCTDNHSFDWPTAFLQQPVLSEGSIGFVRSASTWNWSAIGANATSFTLFMSNSEEMCRISPLGQVTVHEGYTMEDCLRVVAYPRFQQPKKGQAAYFRELASVMP